MGIFSVMLTLHYNSLATYVIGFAFFLWSSTKQSMEQNKSQERVVILFLWSQIITTNKQTTTIRVNWLEETMYDLFFVTWFLTALRMLTWQWHNV